MGLRISARRGGEVMHCPGTASTCLSAKNIFPIEFGDVWGLGFVEPRWTRTMQKPNSAIPLKLTKDMHNKTSNVQTISDCFGAGPGDMSQMWLEHTPRYTFASCFG